EGYAELVEAVARAAALAETARDELEPTDWERNLLARLEAARGELGLEVDRRAYAMAGVVAGARVSVRLEATRSYALVGTIRFRGRLADGATIERRRGPWPWLSGALGLDRPAGDRAFDSMFRVAGALRDRLSERVTAPLMDLSRLGDVTVNEREVVVRIES